MRSRGRERENKPKVVGTAQRRTGLWPGRWGGLQDRRMVLTAARRVTSSVVVVRGEGTAAHSASELFPGSRRNRPHRDRHRVPPSYSLLRSLLSLFCACRQVGRPILHPSSRSPQVPAASISSRYAFFPAVPSTKTHYRPLCQLHHALAAPQSAIPHIGDVHALRRYVSLPG